MAFQPFPCSVCDRISFKCLCPYPHQYEFCPPLISLPWWHKKLAKITARPNPFPL